MQTLLYNLGLSLLLTHELDAVLRAEWTLLYLLRDLPDPASGWVFIYLHIPVLLACLYLGNAKSVTVRSRFRASVCAFLPIHAVVHYSLSDAALYDFHHVLSQLLIYGAALCGVIYIINFLRSRNSG